MMKFDQTGFDLIDYRSRIADWNTTLNTLFLLLLWLPLRYKICRNHLAFYATLCCCLLLEGVDLSVSRIDNYETSFTEPHPHRPYNKTYANPTTDPATTFCCGSQAPPCATSIDYIVAADFHREERFMMHIKRFRMYLKKIRNVALK